MTLFVADLRAFAAAVRRALRENRRYPMLVLGSFFWPILLPAMYVLMGQVYSGGDPRALAAFAARSGTGEVAGFVFVGFAMYMWLSILLWGPGTALRQEQLRGSLEAVFLTPASRLVVLFGPPVASLWPVLLQFAIMAVGLSVLFGVQLELGAMLRALVVIVVGIPAMYGLGAIFASGVLHLGEVGPAVQFVRGICVLACGITYPIVMLPGWAQGVAATLPPTYIVDGMRRVLLAGAGLDEIAVQLGMTLGLAAVGIALAVVLYRWTERQARVSGMLGRF